MVMLLCNIVVMLLRRYATISVPVEVKRILEKVKGDREWGEFLIWLYEEVRKLRGESSFRELVEILSEEELENILKSSREFRKGFVLK